MSCAEHGMTLIFWLRPFLLLLLFLPSSTAQPQFVSIDCGGDQDFKSEEGIQWKTDGSSNFNHTRGLVGSVQEDGSLRRELQSLRYFPATVSPRRSCYALPLETPNASYLLRAGFRYGNYDGLNRPPSFLITLNYDYWAYVQLQSDQTVYLETITTQMVGVSLTFCLIRVDESVPPLVNSLELRFLPSGTYADNNLDLVNSYLHLVSRVNLGGPFVRYPEDAFDRFWEDYVVAFPELKSTHVTRTSLNVSVRYDPAGRSGGQVRSQPPNVVMQTAITGPSQVSFSLDPVPELLLGSDVYTPGNISTWPAFYFAYFNRSEGQDKPFDFACTGLFEEQGANLTKLPDPFITAQYFREVEVPSSFNWTTCSVLKNDTAMIDPILNAEEFFTAQNKIRIGTSLTDVVAWDSVLQSFNLQGLGFGDPCLPTPWDDLGCTPTSATSLPRITDINLSGKNLTGPIPIIMSSFTSLSYLNLSNNKLSGAFPSWFQDLPNLRILDVSNNDLTGRYPQELVTDLGQNFSFSGNKNLCSSHCKESITSAIIAGVVAGGLLVVAMILGPYLYISSLSNSSTNGLFDRDYRDLQARLRNQGAKAQPFSLVKVKKATKNFGVKIGQGGFGSVYRGVLKDGKEVAVKVLSGTSKQGKQEFYNEIELLSVVNHKYLVSLVGYCQSWNQQILIYEFMVGGDLTKRLRGKSASTDPLSWNDRTAIMVEVAEGLDYLHHGCYPAIIHRDVKSNNILLDAKQRAKVGDFGLSKALEYGKYGGTHITTVVKGTTGYLDPEYYITGKLNEKSDVYGYGILMMEILTGRGPVEPTAVPQQIFILDWILQASKNETVELLVDENVKSDYNPIVFSELVRLSLWCVEQKSTRRPSMTDVVHELRLLGLETASTSTKGRRADGEVMESDDEDEGVNTWDNPGNATPNYQLSDGFLST